METGIKVSWSTDDNEEMDKGDIKTEMSIDKDEFGNVYICFDMDRNNQFKRLIPRAYVEKMSYFLDIASYFIKAE